MGAAEGGIQLQRPVLALGLGALVAVTAVVVLLSVGGSSGGWQPAFAGGPDCAEPSWDFDTSNCFGTEGLWHRETTAQISGMTGAMLAFNVDLSCAGPGVIGCTYATGSRVNGRATSPTFTFTNSA